MDWVALREKIPAGIKKYKYALVVLALGLILMMIPSLGQQVDPGEATQETVGCQETGIHEQLSRILSQIQGAGNVEVMLTVSAGERIVYQTDEDISGSESGSTRIETVIVTDADRNQNGLIQQVNPPAYLGAIVVCQGADRPAIRLAIVEAVSRVTGLGADRISVLKMK